MPARSSATTQPAMFAGQDCAKHMPFSMHGMCMAAASIILIETGVLASVSFVARTLISLILGILSLGVVLILSGLTGLGGLVGLIKGPGASQGD
ncbi:MAG: hypothetical protein NVSMB27_09290 [Ktedonobacteraceae bacterium]